MRVTQNMMTNNILQQLSSGYGKIADYQDQLSSGKKITRPSQDPVVAVMSVSYQTDVNHIQQYQSNISTAYNWLDSSESALSSVNDVLNRVRDLTEEVSNGTYDDTQRAAAGTEIDQLTQQLMTLGNTQVGGQYIFNGDDTKNAPITLSDGSYSVSDNSKSVSMAVNDGISIGVNVDPTKVFSSSLFSDLNDLKNALNNPDTSSTQIGDYISKIDTHLDGVADAQADLGALTDRVDMIKSRLGDQETISEKVMSDNEDADYSETIVKLNQQQNVYNAALSVGAKIIQTSLVDYLKN